jgi:hypothetical protein
MTCPLCRQRKAKRACPAVGQEICPVCCGTKRLVEINCPSTCVYLESAARHPAAVVKRQQEADLTVLMGALGQVSEPQLQLFFLIQSFISRAATKSEGLGRLVDADVAEAVGAIAASFETASRGVLYEQTAASPGAESLRRELREFLAHIGRGAGTRFERMAAEVLRGVERGAKHEAPGMGSGAVDYLSLAARILQERAPEPQSISSLILP